MPEYLAPGVYVEETSFRSKSIEGVSTSTAGFVGPARFGPTSGEPELLTSFSDFERIYGGLDQLSFDGKAFDNYLAHAVRAFFEEGGKRLYVSRVFESSGSGGGYAHTTIEESISSNPIDIKARYPGAAANVPLVFTFRFSQNILAAVPADPTNTASNMVPVLRGVREGDLVWLDQVSPPAGDFYWLERYFDEDEGAYSYRFRNTDPDSTPTSSEPKLSEIQPDTAQVRVITVTVAMAAMGKFGEPRVWENLAFHPGHPRALTTVFAKAPSSRATLLFNPLVMETAALNGVEIANALLSQYSLTDNNITIDIKLQDYLEDPDGNPAPSDAALSFQVSLKDGNDGTRPGADEYEGDDGGSDGQKSGFRAFEDIEDISIVAAPGATAGYENGYKPNADTILRHLISHCERMRYRIAVLDSADKHLLSQVRAYRGQLDSTHAALYYPWVRILDPVTEQEINLPPSGFVTGIYARNDVETGVHKAPANEVVRLAINFEQLVNKGQQEVLNPEGVNCFRFFPGRGYLLWGARTISSDPEWKYVSSRRYFAYLERSIEKGTQWAVFEPNGDALWANVRQTISDFLFNEWKSGRLLGLRPEDAYFVRCDRSTMTQNDLDNGRLVCLIGVAILKPAEFVIFRIGQWTGDSRG